MIALNEIHAVEARDGLAQLPDDSIDCVLTSPPYWAQRDYDVAATDWSDGWKGALGLEPGPQQYVNHLVEVMSGIKRVLKPSGTVWVNLGDCYAGPWSIGTARGSPAGRNAPSGMATGWNHPANPRRSAVPRAPYPVPDKCLFLIPERFAVRMAESGWILRNRIVWHKPNAHPASVKDRFSCSWEYLLLFSRSERYYFDLDAVRVACKSRSGIQQPATTEAPRGRNPGDCWSISTQGRAGVTHPAVFPEALCERPILAGCPPGGVVLDPFAGSGTTCAVAKRLGRQFIGFELNPAYAEHARQRMASIAAPEKGGGGRDAAG